MKSRTRRSSPAATGGSSSALVRQQLLDVAMRIHQEPAQYLAHALSYLRLCGQDTRAHPARTGIMRSQAITWTQAALDSLRATIHTLRHALEAERPIILSRGASPPAPDGDGALPSALETGLRAVVCEAVTNAIKHADARRITIGLRIRRGELWLDVEDNGRGFDTPRAGKAGRRGGAGLGLMEAQVSALGGTLRIHRLSRGGTRVGAVIPLPLEAGPRAPLRGKRAAG